MSDTILVTEPLTDVIEVDPEGTLEAILVVTPPVDAIELETDVLIGQGPKGDTGDPPPVSKYLAANSAVSNGVLTVNAASASTFYVVLDQNVSSLVVTDWANDKAQRIHIYAQQDSTGGRLWDANAFPSGTRWSYGLRPSGSDPNSIESFVLEHLPTGNLVFAALVGQRYS